VFSVYLFFTLLVRVIFFFYAHRINVLQQLSGYFLSLSLFFVFFSIGPVYFSFDFFSDLSSVSAMWFKTFESQFFVYFMNFLNFNFYLLNIYYFPFIYIFVVVTVLSIFFCLAYNINETIIFIFYCVIIVVAGFMLFFTDTLILFFLAYELLLVPSFFILYKFAKTRRCIEAAYLMFF